MSTLPILAVEPPPVDTVALWYVETGLSEELFAACEEVLSGEERLRAASFHFEKDRRQFVAARGSLRHLLGSLLRIEAKAVEFDYGPFGKPFIPIQSGAETVFRFNLAHSGCHILIGVSPNLEIGVDLEVLCPGETRMAPLVRNICTGNETEWVSDLPAGEKEFALSRLWTAKEAILKSIGSGFQIPPDQVEIEEAVLHGAVGAFAAKILAQENDRSVEVFPLPDFESTCACSAALAVASGSGSVRIDRRGPLWK